MRRRVLAAAPVLVGPGLGTTPLRDGVPGSGAHTGKEAVGGAVNVTPDAHCPQ